jgi:hypothetical protein
MAERGERKRERRAEEEGKKPSKLQRATHRTVVDAGAWQGAQDSRVQHLLYGLDGAGH